jgi:hypothetical protein
VTTRLTIDAGFFKQTKSGRIRHIDIVAAMPPHTQPREKPLAGDIAALDDERLKKYLRDNGGVVSVRDYWNLPESFME